MPELADLPHGVLDLPLEGQIVDGLLTVQGWMLHSPEDGMEPFLTLGKERTPLAVARSVRPDVARGYPEYGPDNPFPGFHAVLSTHAMEDGEYLLQWGGRSSGEERILGSRRFQIRNTERTAFYKRIHEEADQAVPQEKRAILKVALACPTCLAPISPPDQGPILCSACGVIGRMAGSRHVFGEMADDVHGQEQMVSGETSSYPYPDPVLIALEEVCLSGGTALDIGSGSRLYGADRLVQLEIAPYPFTDVVSRSERLPFRDGAFDYVFSLSTLEHVRHPWVMAREMERILAPEGRIYIETAFLQPYHGYPSHFYNMSDEALKDLFPSIEIERVGPGPNQLPWHSLQWMINSLLRDLTPKDAARLSNLSLGELVAEMNRFTAGQESLLDHIPLPEAIRRELAAGFTLAGRKAL